MAMLNIFKKTKIPDELPDLATDEIEMLTEDKLEDHNSIVLDQLKEETKTKKTKIQKKEEIEPEIEDRPLQINPPVENYKENPKPKLGKSFFDNLQENISEEIENLDKLEDWYEHKFLPQDIVSSMRNYWEGQKSNSVLKVIGKNFKERINEKTVELQKLEHEWQNIYFDLIEKEEEIRDKEKELKKVLSEFVELCKIKKKSELDVGDNGQRKEGKKPKKKKSES